MATSGVCNDDSRSDNFNLQRVSSTATSEVDYRAIAFDFGQARVRRDAESDHEWKAHKFKKDKEGCVLANICTKLGSSVN
jgi:hypothetical protein